MKPIIAASAIIGIAAVVCTGLIIYFSEYQTCIRSADTPNAKLAVACRAAGK